MINYLTNRGFILAYHPHRCTWLMTHPIDPSSAQPNPGETEDVPSEMSPFSDLNQSNPTLTCMPLVGSPISQSDHRLVHQKLPRARLYMGIYYTIFGASMLWSANGLYKLIRVSNH
ncbi:hypothetical protein VP01_2751g2 [Puccinia sorghi]|uniref:Uncharacterized protein n=1 Tax=Puccinia sorghi TaxID=27349 RepID=A0A0L6V336_9BASI|nr:hypothetical protein VP01_2751g2 [Puccinia sorghi]